MTDQLRFALTLTGALGCGLVAGVFFAFSTFIMRALARLPAAQGVAAMQSINVAVITPSFMLALFGTGAVCVFLSVFSLFKWQERGAGYLLAGSLIYLFGTIVVTIVFNVPRNDALANNDPASIEGIRFWTDYVSTWTTWNHVRTVAALIASALFTVALRSAA